jgi:hypothetical protein
VSQDDCMLDAGMLRRAGISVRSPLVGEGQGGGCHTTCCFDSPGDTRSLLSKNEPFQLIPFLRRRGSASNAWAACDTQPARFQRGLV